MIAIDKGGGGGERKQRLIAIDKGGGGGERNKGYREDALKNVKKKNSNYGCTDRRSKRKIFLAKIFTDK